MPSLSCRTRCRVRRRGGDRLGCHGRAGARNGAAGGRRARAQDLSAVCAPRRPLHQHRHRAALLGRAEEWYLQPHTWEDRTRSYQRHALDLLERVATQAVAEAGLALRDIDTIVTNTVTGLAIPSLEARLMNRLAFRRDVRAAADLRARMRRRRRRACAARRAWRKRGRAPTFCFLRSTCARSACASTIRASPCLSPLRCLATGGRRRAAQPLEATGAAEAPRRAPHRRHRRIFLVEYRAHHGLGHQGRRLRHRIEPGAAGPDARAARRGAVSVFRARRAVAAGLRRLPIAPRRQQGAADRGGGARVVARSTPLLMAGAEKLRQHVVGDSAVRAEGGARRQGAWPLSCWRRSVPDFPATSSCWSSDRRGTADALHDFGSDAPEFAACLLPAREAAGEEIELADREDALTCAIGDVHGHIGKLEKLLRTLRGVRARPRQSASCSSATTSTADPIAAPSSTC